MWKKELPWLRPNASRFVADSYVQCDAYWTSVNPIGKILEKVFTKHTCLRVLASPSKNEVLQRPFLLWLGTMHAVWRVSLINQSVLCVADVGCAAMPDERAIMTYISSYYHVFSGAIQVRTPITPDVTLPTSWTATSCCEDMAIKVTPCASSGIPGS